MANRVTLANNVSTVLKTAITTSSLSLVVLAGTGVLFPTLTDGDYCYVTIASTANAIEIVKMTAKSGDTLTITRAQEGTTAKAFAAGSRVEIRVTAQSVIDTVTAGIEDYNLMNVQPDIASLTAADTSGGAAILTLDPKQGLFLHDATTLASSVTWDTENSKYVPDSGTHVWVRNSDLVTLEHFGIKGSGEANQDQWAAVIAAINADKVRDIYCPPGMLTYLEDNLAAITNTNGFTLRSSGYAACQIRMKNTAGDKGKFLQIGDATHRVLNWNIEGIKFVADNATSLTGTEWQLFMMNAGAGKVIDCDFSGGLPAKFGSAAYNCGSLLVNNTAFRGLGTLPAAGVLFENASSIDFMRSFVLADTGGSAYSASFMPMKLAPPTNGNIDSMTFYRLVMNMDQTLDCLRCMEIDASYDDIGTVRFYNSYFEQTSGAPVHIHSNNGSAGFAKKITFEGCRFTPKVTKAVPCVLIENTNDVGMEVKIDDSIFNTPIGPALELTGTAASVNTNVTANNNQIVDRRGATLAGALHPVFKIGVNGFTAKSNKVSCDYYGEATRFDSAVQFTADVTVFDISGNDFGAVASVPLFNTALLTGASVWTDRQIRGNLGSPNQLPFYTTWTNDNTARVIATFPLTDETIVMAKARVMIRKSNTTVRGYYEFVGGFYRDAGGSVVQQGATTSLVSIGSVAGLDAAFSVSGNNLRLTATADNAVGTYDVFFDIEISAAL